MAADGGMPPIGAHAVCPYGGGEGWMNDGE